jgi:hypothetical protein
MQRLGSKQMTVDVIGNLMRENEERPAESQSKHEDERIYKACRLPSSTRFLQLPAATQTRAEVII